MLKPGQTFGGMVKGSAYSNNGRKASVSLYGMLNDDWGAMASYVKTDRNDMRDGNGDDLESTASDQTLGFFKIAGDIDNNNSLKFSYENQDESGDFAQRPNWPVASWSPESPMDIERKTMTLNHKFSMNEMVNLETTLYRTERELAQDGRWGLYATNIESVGFDIRNTSKLASHKLTYGAEMRQDNIDSETKGVSPSDRVAEEGQVAGLYIQDHWNINDDLLMSFGVRYDRYDLEQGYGTVGESTDSAGFSPNIGFVYDINDKLALSVGHARAMRGKEIGDGFTNWAAATDVTIDPDLDPERVSNTELGLEYSADNLLMKASVYRSVIDDVIADQLGQGTYYENIGELESTGLELQAAYQLDKLMLSASISRNNTELNGEQVEGYEHVALANSRGDTLSLGARYQYSPKLQFGWNFTYVQDLNDLELFHRMQEIGWSSGTEDVDKPGYKVHDIYLTWMPLADDSLTVDLAVQNLFDEYYIDHSSVGDYNHIASWEGVGGQPEKGRDFRASLKYKF